MGDGKIRFALPSLTKKPAKSGAFNYRQIIQTQLRTLWERACSRKRSDIQHWCRL